MAVKRKTVGGRARAPEKKSRTAKAPRATAAPRAARAAAEPAARGKGKPAAKPGKRAASKPARRARATAAGETVMFQKVAFTLLSIEEPLRARGFYEDVLGLTRGLASPDGTWTEYDLPGGGCLALFRHPDPKHARAPGGGASVALEVADLDALNERLKQAGVVYEGDVVHGPHCRMSNIRDSEGNSLILHQLNRA